MKSITVKLTQQEQWRISMECKRNPKKIWQYVNRHTKSKTDIGDLKWHDKNGDEKIAESNDGKATILQNFFSSAYSTLLNLTTSLTLHLLGRMCKSTAQPSQ